MVYTLPFMYDLLGQEAVSGLKFQRLVAIPFLGLSLLAPKQRTLQMHHNTVVLMVVALISILVMSDVQEVVQDVPLSPGMTEKMGMKNFIAQFFDNAIKILFLYFVFTRLNNKEINSAFILVLFFGLCQSLTLIYLVSINPEMVLEYGKATFGVKFDKEVLWKNPFFGHKNDWGMYGVYIIYMAFIKKLIEDKLHWFYSIVIVAAVITVGLALSRQAYVFTGLAFILIVLWKRNFKFVLYFIIFAVALLLFTPDFIANRMETFVAVDSGGEFQQLSRKVSDLAINQAVSNLTILPRMFVIEWEYNWSEGFWNGFLHQQGILGLVFLLYVYFHLFQRANFYHNCKRDNLSNIGMLLKIFLVLMFFGCFNRRDTNFMNYYGNIRPIGFLFFFLLFYAEYMYFSMHKTLKSQSSKLTEAL